MRLRRPEPAEFNRTRFLFVLGDSLRPRIAAVLNHALRISARLSALFRGHREKGTVLLLYLLALALRAGNFRLVMLRHGHGERKLFLAVLAPVIIDRHKLYPFR